MPKGAIRNNSKLREMDTGFHQGMSKETGNLNGVNDDRDCSQQDRLITKTLIKPDSVDTESH